MSTRLTAFHGEATIWRRFDFRTPVNSFFILSATSFSDNSSSSRPPILSSVTMGSITRRYIPCHKVFERSQIVQHAERGD